MSIISKTFTFSSGATIVASEFNTNYDNLYNDYNGNITKDNISSSAAIEYSKLDLTGEILNADISTSASMAASKMDLAAPGWIGSGTPSRGFFTEFDTNTAAIASLQIGTGATVTNILDQDDMSSDSATSLVTQQSVKKYVDDADAGMWKYVSTTTVTDTTASANIAITQGSIYKVLFVSESTSNNDTVMGLQFNADTGSNYANNGEAAGAASEVTLSGVVGTEAEGGGISGEVILTPVNTDMMCVTGHSVGVFKISGGTNDVVQLSVAGLWDASTTVTSFRLVKGDAAQSGDFTGTIYLYSLVTS